MKPPRKAGAFTVPVVEIVAMCDEGMRGDPDPRNGLAHLFETEGVALIPDLVDAATLTDLCAEADAFLSSSATRGGVRNLLAKSALCRSFAESGPPAELAVGILGPDARPTKLTLFDKTPEANWKVPWHQDLTIALRERRDVPGYGPWSVKDGVPHVQPPVAVLERTVAVRLHLDDTAADHGALRVLPGTHRSGRLSDLEIARLRREIEEIVCPLAAGSAMLLSPLLLHASSPAISPSRRRVLHFEFSSAELPGGLAWR
jgi:hypothetical protein